MEKLIAGVLWIDIRKIPGPEIQLQYGGDPLLPAMFAERCRSDIKYQHELCYFEQPAQWWKDIAEEWSNYRECSLSLH